MKNLQQRIKNLTDYWMDFLLPPLCISCKTEINSHNSLCPKCWHQVNFIVSPICDIMGTPLPYNTGTVQISAVATTWPPPYNRARSVAVFEGILKHMIHALKYGDRHEGIKLFGKWMTYAGRDILNDADLIIPVPLSQRRLWARRFNQSALLANAIGKNTKIQVDYLSLKRKKHTTTQVGLTRKQRAKNVSGAFSIPAKALPQIAGKNIVLVDDVLTTGATIHACTKTLLKAKAARIDILTLARVIDQVPLDL